MPYWYKQVVWGRFDRYNSTGWMISKPTVSSGEAVTVPGSLPEADLMLPEFLKGKLSLDEWKILIALHLVRFKTYNQTRMSRLLGKVALAPRGLFFLLLFYIPAAATGGLSGPVLYFPSPIFLVAALWIRRSLRKSLKRREFELDRNVAEQLGVPQVLQVLEKILNLDRIRIPTNLRFPALVGFGIFWISGLVAGNLYARGQSMVACMDTSCSAFVVIAAVGFWMATIGGISIVVWILRRFL